MNLRTTYAPWNLFSNYLGNKWSTDCSWLVTWKDHAMQWHLTPQIIFKWNCNADSPGSQKMKHFSAQWASWCHLKIAADTLIFKQNRRDVDYLFSFTLILLLNHLSFFFQTLKQQNSPFYQRLLLEVAGCECQPDSYNPPKLSSVLLSPSLLPSLGEITLKIFFALGKTHHITFDYDLYIYGRN